MCEGFPIYKDGIIHNEDILKYINSIDAESSEEEKLKKFIALIENNTPYNFGNTNDKINNFLNYLFGHDRLAVLKNLFSECTKIENKYRIKIFILTNSPIYARYIALCRFHKKKIVKDYDEVYSSFYHAILKNINSDINVRVISGHPNPRYNPDKTFILKEILIKELIKGLIKGLIDEYYKHQGIDSDARNWTWLDFAYKLSIGEKKPTVFNGGFKKRLFLANENHLYYIKVNLKDDLTEIKLDEIKLDKIKKISLNIIKGYHEDSHSNRLILYNNKGKVELVLQNYNEDFRSWVVETYLPVLHSPVSSDLGLKDIVPVGQEDVEQEHVNGGKKKRKNRKSKKK